MSALEIGFFVFVIFVGFFVFVILESQSAKWYEK